MRLMNLKLRCFLKIRDFIGSANRLDVNQNAFFLVSWFFTWLIISITASTTGASSIIIKQEFDLHEEYLKLKEFKHGLQK